MMEHIQNKLAIFCTYMVDFCGPSHIFEFQYPIIHLCTYIVLALFSHYPVPLMFDLDGLEYFSSGKPLHKDGQILNVGSITGTYSEKNKERPQTLYKHVFNATYPSMAFVGIALTDLPFLCCDLQVRWVFSVWTGFTDLPSAEEMITDSEADYKSWRMLGLSHSHYTHLLSDRKWEYFRELAAKGASKQPECVVKKLHDAIYHYKTTNGKGYKRYQFAVTGYSSFLELSEHKGKVILISSREPEQGRSTGD